MQRYKTVMDYNDRRKMSGIGRKIVRVIIGLVYFNICLLLLAIGIYSDIFTLTLVIIDQIVYVTDTLIRPATPREGFDSTTKVIGLLFLLHPFILTLLFYENLLVTSIYLPFLNSPFVATTGIVIYLIGASITLTSRTQLGRYGDGTTMLKGDHHLLTKGIYKYIRHPLYSGALLGRVGIGLSFRSFIGMVLFSAIYFVIFKKRMDIEEETLKVEFGKGYEDYMEQTKRLIPFLY